jgi:hypothetical protein
LVSDHVARVHDVRRLESGAPFMVMELREKSVELRGELSGKLRDAGFQVAPRIAKARHERKVALGPLNRASGRFPRVLELCIRLVPRNLGVRSFERLDYPEWRRPRL